MLHHTLLRRAAQIRENAEAACLLARLRRYNFNHTTKHTHNHISARPPHRHHSYCILQGSWICSSLSNTSYHTCHLSHAYAHRRFVLLCTLKPSLALCQHICVHCSALPHEHKPTMLLFVYSSMINEISATIYGLFLSSASVLSK